MTSKSIHEFFKTRREISLFTLVLLLVPGLFACQKMVEKERMDAVGNWAIAMCKCAEKSDTAEAKACAEALKQPQLDLLNSSGRTKYKLESVHAYGEIESTGSECMRKIMSR